MKVEVIFIDRRGMMSFRLGKSKKLVRQWIDSLDPRTSVTWLQHNQVQLSQQYIKAPERKVTQ